MADQGEQDKAIAEFDKALAIDPHDPDSYNNRGVAWYFKGQHDKALADYNRAIEPLAGL